MDSSIACHKFTCSVSFDKKCFSRCHSYALIMPLDTEMRGRMPQYQIEKPFARCERLMDLIVGGESVVIELYPNLCSGNTRQLPPEVCICICRVEKLGQATERHQSRQMGPSNLWPLLCSYSIVASRGEQALSWLDRSIRSQDRQSHATPRRMHRLSTGALGTPKLAAYA